MRQLLRLQLKGPALNSSTEHIARSWFRLGRHPTHSGSQERTVGRVRIAWRSSNRPTCHGRETGSEWTVAQHALLRRLLWKQG